MSAGSPGRSGRNAYFEFRLISEPFQANGIGFDVGVLRTMDTNDQFWLGDAEEAQVGPSDASSLEVSSLTLLVDKQFAQGSHFLTRFQNHVTGGGRAIQVCSPCRGNAVQAGWELLESIFRLGACVKARIKSSLIASGKASKSGLRVGRGGITIVNDASRPQDISRQFQTGGRFLVELDLKRTTVGSGCTAIEADAEDRTGVRTDAGWDRLDEFKTDWRLQLGDGDRLGASVSQLELLDDQLVARLGRTEVKRAI